MGRRILLQTYQILADPNPVSAEPPVTTSTDDKMAANLQNQYQNRSFDSSMGLTILVLLSALFFMGFFSVYIRRFANDSPVHLSRSRRRLRSTLASTSSTTLPNVSRLCGARKGLDFDSIQALPVVKFCSDLGSGMVGVVDCCAVCLAEFEDGESVKMLPTCQHLFHVECIDTWLVARASCPLCRTTKIFKEEKAEVVVDVTEASGGGVRRCCSCSGIDVVVVMTEEESDSAEGRRGGLQRTRSF